MNDYPLPGEVRVGGVHMNTQSPGLTRSTVYDHLEELQELDVVEHTRKIGGSPLYQLNKDSEVAKKFAQLEWALLDVVGE